MLYDSLWDSTLSVLCDPSPVSAATSLILSPSPVSLFTPLYPHWLHGCSSAIWPTSSVSKSLNICCPSSLGEIFSSYLGDCPSPLSGFFSRFIRDFPCPPYANNNIPSYPLSALSPPPPIALLSN